MTGSQEHILDPNQVQDRLLPLLASGAEVPLLVTGTSMIPFLWDRRDTVFLRSPAQVPPRRGDILFFRRTDGSWILHRLDRITPDGRWLINGDAQNWLETIHPSQTAGVVTQISRDGGVPFPARRWDRRFLQQIWRLLRPVRPSLLRVIGRLRRGTRQ